MGTILDELLKEIPEKERATITDSEFEGANIVLYTKDEYFFMNGQQLIRDLVNNFKKRIELRMDPSKVMELEDAEKAIRELIPAEAGIGIVTFDIQRSRVIVEVEKPGVAIGKAGDILKEIKSKTKWTPQIRRKPSIRSKLIENIRHVLYENNDYRKKFLDRVGKRIYGGWKRDRKSDWIRVSFLGGAREVGRSCILLQTSESRVLMDCGVNVAAQDDKDAYPILEAPEFDINDIDAIIVSHAHLDHIGLVPYLYKFGYKGPCYMTSPTRDVGALLCLDYVSIAQKENKKELYTATEVKEMVKHTICLSFDEVSDITPDLRLTFYNSGHTLGASMVHLNIGNGQHNLLYTGDMNYERSNLLAAAVTKFPRLETVIIESTYGSKDDVPETRVDAENIVVDIVKRTLERKGKVLMPVLGVGRSQEVLLILERQMREGGIPKVPIFIHGSVWDVVAIHTAYPDYFNSQIKRAIFHNDENPFTSDVFKNITSQKEMKAVIEDTGPCIIVATSGMMVGGPSVEYFKALAESDRNSLILTCYQGEGSLGRRLENGDKQINMAYGANRPDIINVNMEIRSIHGFTGHSDYNQLNNFCRRLEPRPKKIIVMHGEKSKTLEFASNLHKTLKIETAAPKNLEAIRLR
ncbi:beta-CASP ribonuclease aCPSF1 [Candidatus Woesearchaeota archaeon]|nr:beta-CASP ribonuclease aCPSF1 [Candidatus Woesearchaeota archaeon]